MSTTSNSFQSDFDVLHFDFETKPNMQCLRKEAVAKYEMGCVQIAQFCIVPTLFVIAGRC